MRTFIQPGLLIALLIAATSCAVNAQNANQLIREGNKQYKENKFADSEIKYRKGLDKEKNSFEAEFNLGDALYKQGKYDQATERFSSLASREKDKSKQATAYHNLGNALLKQKKYEESINAYKNALKNQPTDKDTKYNLAYAQSYLKQQQQQQQQQNKEGDKKDQKDQQQQKQQQSQKQDDKKKEDQKQQQAQQSKEDNKKEGKQAEAGKEKDKISKEDAERILQALNNEEKDTQKKLSRKESDRMNIEKDW